ncbi:NAD-dependent protein deacetylase sirtuin-2 [Nowakowskiella sp. JEL0407]|nr:NAD-dependent protein deacetylase sirtuin-2 [Nowakowskiella sp. JEL0407]
MSEETKDKVEIEANEETLSDAAGSFSDLVSLLLEKRNYNAGINRLQEKMFDFFKLFSFSPFTYCFSSSRRFDPSLCILPDSTIESFTDHLKSENLSKIIVLTGAGISTSAGIPDFRSPGSGLYDNLQQYDLPYPEAIFDINYFHNRPDPFYVLAKEMFPGRFDPTYAHYFISLLAKKGLLLRNYTQNIDTLERVAGVPEEKLVEAHGSFADAKCVGRKSEDSNEIIPGCNASYSNEWFLSKISDSETDGNNDTENNNGRIARCTDCNGLVKPSIVFFGEQLPERFHQLAATDFEECDSVIIMGTSLTVYPFASLVDFCDDTVPRLLVNKTHPPGAGRGKGFDFTGETHKYRRDALFLGDIEEGILRFAELMGFKDELIDMREEGLKKLREQRSPQLSKKSDVKVLATTTTSEEAIHEKVNSELASILENIKI